MNGADFWQQHEQELQQQYDQDMKGGYFLPSSNGCGFAPPSEPFKDTNMPKISEMLPSNYLKQADFPEDYIVTVRKIEKKNIAMDGKPADWKWLAFYDEFEKPMVLNSTNIQLMSKACGSEDTDDWIGKQIIVYVDENVSFGGELVGGLRIRKHQQAAPVVPKAKPASPRGKSEPPAEFDDVPDEFHE
jgi:hypothetical protein